MKIHPIIKLLLPIFLFFALAWAIHRWGNHDLLLVFLSISLALPVLYLILDRSHKKNLVLHMRQEALRAEVTLLKNQINPHFFFNTLNNLYGLVLAQSPDAPGLVLKLSDLMRFTIYEGRKDHVPLRDEITYLENYLEIQRIRTQHKKVALKFATEVADDSLEMPPLMLIILVENAFKHGVTSLESEAFIEMELKATLTTLDFCVRNNYDANQAGPKGIGLENLERRLALIFPEKYHFQTQGEDGIFLAQLRLSL